MLLHALKELAAELDLEKLLKFYNYNYGICTIYCHLMVFICVNGIICICI